MSCGLKPGGLKSYDQDIYYGKLFLIGCTSSLTSYKIVGAPVMTLLQLFCICISTVGFQHLPCLSWCTLSHCMLIVPGSTILFFNLSTLPDQCLSCSANMSKHDSCFIQSSIRYPFLQSLLYVSFCICGTVVFCYFLRQCLCPI